MVNLPMYFIIKLPRTWQEAQRVLQAFHRSYKKGAIGP